MWIVLSQSMNCIIVNVCAGYYKSIDFAYAIKRLRHSNDIVIWTALIYRQCALFTRVNRIKRLFFFSGWTITFRRNHWNVNKFDTQSIHQPDNKNKNKIQLGRSLSRHKSRAKNNKYLNNTLTTVMTINLCDNSMRRAINSKSQNEIKPNEWKCKMHYTSPSYWF